MLISGAKVQANRAAHARREVGAKWKKPETRVSSEGAIQHDQDK